MVTRDGSTRAYLNWLNLGLPLTPNPSPRSTGARGATAFSVVDCVEAKRSYNKTLARDFWKIAICRTAQAEPGNQMLESE
jgi:hypothetical protein